MADESEQDRHRQRSRRQIRWTAALLGGLATLIYLGFISRGVFG